jgi:hemolysin D
MFSNAIRTSRAVLEFQSPTAAVIERPLPRGARMTTWVIAGALLSSTVIMGTYPVDKVVAVPGKVVATTPNVVVQPLETAIVRQIAVREGQVVHPGDRLAMLDPTMASADAAASDAQVVSLRAEVNRLEAESEGRAYSSDGSQASQLQAVIYSQRHAEMQAKLENYNQHIASLHAKVEQTSSDINSYAEQYKVAQTKENMRRELEHLQVGSKLSTLDADAQRAEVNRALQSSFAAHKSAHAELDGVVAERDEYIQRFKTETAQQLAEQGRKLAEAEEQAKKAALWRRLVDRRADRDAVVLSVSKLSVGSVVQSGDELMTLVPADARPSRSRSTSLPVTPGSCTSATAR